MDISFVYCYTIYCSSAYKKDVKTDWRYTFALNPYIIKSNIVLTNEEIEEEIKRIEKEYMEKEKNKEIVRVVAKAGIEITGLYKTTKGKKAKTIIYVDKNYCYRPYKFADRIMKYDPSDVNEKVLIMTAKIRRMEEKLKIKGDVNYEI